MNEQLFKELIGTQQKIVIELGCGPSKKQGVIGIDAFALPGVDIVTNLENGLTFIPDNTVDELFSVHFLEHISNLEFLIKEIHRVLKPGGLHNVIVPHFSNPHYYSDLTHKKFFGLYTFDYYATDTSKLRRAVPGFYNDFKFSIHKRKLIFKSQFVLRNLIKKWIFTKLFNINSFMQELYEECFTGLLPCSEIEFTMKPQKPEVNA